MREYFVGMLKSFNFAKGNRIFHVSGHQDSLDDSNN
jgi:hypothetical protein